MEKEIVLTGKEYNDIIDNLFLTKCELNDKDILNIYKYTIKFFNKYEVSRYSAGSQGNMGIIALGQQLKEGNIDFDISELFTFSKSALKLKYHQLSMYLMNILNQQPGKCIYLTVCIMYLFVACYINSNSLSDSLDDETLNFIEENDKIKLEGENE